MTALTPINNAQLLGLIAAGAVDRAHGASIYRLPTCTHPGLARLRALGLSDCAVVRRLGQQWTSYWLTPSGLEAARALAEHPNAA